MARGIAPRASGLRSSGPRIGSSRGPSCTAPELRVQASGRLVSARTPVGESTPSSSGCIIF
eukprot:2724723-Alexandrium_andersonii.AAC.1